MQINGLKIKDRLFDEYGIIIALKEVYYKDTLIFTGNEIEVKKFVTALNTFCNVMYDKG